MCHRSFACFQHFLAVRQLELVWKRLHQPLVDTLRSFHPVTIFRFI